MLRGLPPFPTSCPSINHSSRGTNEKRKTFAISVSMIDVLPGIAMFMRGKWVVRTRMSYVAQTGSVSALILTAHKNPTTRKPRQA